MWQPGNCRSDPLLCCVWLAESPNYWPLNLPLPLPRGHPFHKLLPATWCGRHAKRGRVLQKAGFLYRAALVWGPPVAWMKHCWMILQSESLLNQPFFISSHPRIVRPASGSEWLPHLLSPLPFLPSDGLNTSLACWIPSCCLLPLECLSNCFITYSFQSSNHKHFWLLYFLFLNFFKIILDIQYYISFTYIT